MTENTARQIMMEKANSVADMDFFMTKHASALEKGTAHYTGALNRVISTIAKDIVENFGAYNSDFSHSVGRTLLNDMGPELLANIISYKLAEGASSKSGRTDLFKATAELLAEVSIEMTLRNHADKRVQDVAKKNLAKSASSKELSVALKTLAERVGISVEDQEIMFQVSQNLMVKAMERSGLFVEGTKLNKHDNVTATVEFNEKALEAIDVNAAELSENAITYRPLVTVPRDWTSVNNGGYYTDAFQFPVVNARGPRVENAEYFEMLNNDAKFTRFLNAINEAQHTGFCVNKKVLALANKVLRSKGDFLGIPSSIKVKDDVKKELARAGKLRADKATIKMATEYKDEDAIYFVYQADFRGRLYNMCSDLNTQGSDLSKGLLQFANGKALGKDGYKWLSIHAANTYGGEEALDKCSFNDRVKFVENNEKMIKIVAKGDVKSANFVKIMEKAENPFMFYAVCAELVKLIDKSDLQKSRFVSHIPVGMDGTCNGQQWAAGFLRSASLAENVNLVKSSWSDVPNDLYRSVADGIIEFFSDKDVCLNKAFEKLNKKVVVRLAKNFLKADRAVQRKVVKRATMTEAYAVTPLGQREMLWKDAPDSFKTKIADVKETVYKTVYGVALAYGLAKSCMASRDSMDFFKSCAKALPNQTLFVTNPIGFTMKQSYKVEKDITLESTIASKRVKVHYKVRTNKIYQSKQVSAIAPNVTHSHDSAHMLMVVEAMASRGMSWLLVHDDYATHACDITEMHKVIRSTFVEIHNQDRLGCLRDEVVAQGADISKIGISREVDGKKVWIDNVLHNDFNLNDVMESTYFFA